MKTIESINVWFNGQQVSANILNANSINDNLQSFANFQYQIMREVHSEQDSYVYLEVVAQSVLMMQGEAYENWDTNDYAYEWIAQQLNLTITGEYVPPAPPQLEPTPEPEV